MTHIALEGGCFVLSANQFCRRKDYPPPPEYVFAGLGEEPSPDTVICPGGSVIISPSGEVLAGPNYEGEALITADLGMKLIRYVLFYTVQPPICFFLVSSALAVISIPILELLNTETTIRVTSF